MTTRGARKKNKKNRKKSAKRGKPRNLDAYTGERG
jgi:hypothetical protein